MDVTAELSGVERAVWRQFEGSHKLLCREIVALRSVLEVDRRRSRVGRYGGDTYYCETLSPVKVDISAIEKRMVAMLAEVHERSQDQCRFDLECQRAHIED